MAILRPTWQDIITEHSVQTWQDWPWDTWLGPYAVISPRRYRVRVRVYRAGEWVDITSRVASGVIRESNDQPVATLELRLLNGREYDSLAPRRKDSPLNRVNGQYVPLLWIGRLIAVEAAFSEDGSEPDEWWPVFLGELEDEIDTESGPDGTYVRLFCRDMAARLQRDYIAGPLTYENMFASQMIQQILNDRYAAGALPEPVTLRVVGQDDFFVERYDIEYTDLWSALQRFCQQRGTDLRYRLNEQTGQIELTYWLPDRAMVPGWIIDGAQIRREELRISGTDIINRVTVRYRDAATGQRAEVAVQDADSIAMYGLRHGLIEEPDTDLIPDAATAQRLAQTIVDDLKDVPALTRLTVPFDPRVQVFDKLRVANPAVRDEPEDYAIEGRELSFSATDWGMTLIGGGRVVVKRQAWLERLATAGVKQPFTPRDMTTAREPGAPTGLTGQFVGTDAVFSWDESLDPYHRRFVVEVRVGGQVKRRDYVEATSYTYTLDMNRHDNGTPSPQVEVRVYHEYTTGAVSPPAIVAVSHPVPSAPTVTARSSSAQVRWAVTSEPPVGWKDTIVQAGSFQETVAALAGVIDAQEARLADGQIATVSVRVRNVFGQMSSPGTAQTTVNYLDKLQFAQDIKPVVLVSTLPQLPNPEYPQGSVVFLTTNNKLYRSTGDEWTTVVDGDDIPEGEIKAHHLAANSVTAGAIAAGAVKADAIAAGAVTADKLAANSVSADKIYGGTLRLTGDMAIEAANNAVRIDGEGIWGYSGSTKRAGFGTDGRWVAGGGAIEADEDGLRGKKGNTTTFEIKSNGDAYFGGQLSADSVLSNSSLLSALTDFDSTVATNEVSPTSDNWHNMPGMSLQVNITRPTLLFVIIDTGTTGIAYQIWIDSQGAYRERWAEVRFRLLINGSVRFTSPWTAFPAPLFLVTQTEAGSNNLQVQWQVSRNDASLYEIKSGRRGIYVMKFGR